MAVLDGDSPYDVLDVLEIEGDVARVRSPFLFEIGEELKLQIDDQQAAARVRAHVGDVTELELL